MNETEHGLLVAVLLALDEFFSLKDFGDDAAFLPDSLGSLFLMNVCDMRKVLELRSLVSRQDLGFKKCVTLLLMDSSMLHLEQQRLLQSTVLLDLFVEEGLFEKRLRLEQGHLILNFLGGMVSSMVPRLAAVLTLHQVLGPRARLIFYIGEFGGQVRVLILHLNGFERLPSLEGLRPLKAGLHPIEEPFLKHHSLQRGLERGFELDCLGLQFQDVSLEVLSFLQQTLLALQKVVYYFTIGFQTQLLLHEHFVLIQCLRYQLKN